MKKITKIVTAGVLLISLTGCGKIPTLSNGEEAIFTLNDSKTSITTLYETLKDKYGIGTLVDLIDKSIFDKKYSVTEDETSYIDNSIKSLKESAESYNTTYEYLISYYYGLSSEAELKDYLSLSYRRDYAVKEYLKGKLTSNEMKDYYENSIKGTVEVKHILIAPETVDGMTDEEKTAAEAAALKEAKSIIKKLDNGEKWDTLASKYSDDSNTASKGGDLGWVSSGDMVTEFEDAAFALKKGKYSTTPVKTTYGYHIIYKIDEKAKPSYKDSKDEIMEKLVAQKLTDDKSLSYSVLEQIRKDEGLKITDSDLSKDYQTYMSNLKTQAKNSTTQSN